MYRYAALPSPRLTAKRRAIGTKRVATSLHSIFGFSVHPNIRHKRAKTEMKSMCIMTSVIGKWNFRSDSRYLLKRMIVDDRNIHCTIRYSERSFEPTEELSITIGDTAAARATASAGGRICPVQKSVREQVYRGAGKASVAERERRTSEQAREDPPTHTQATLDYS